MTNATEAERALRQIYNLLKSPSAPDYRINEAARIADQALAAIPLAAADMSIQSAKIDESGERVDAVNMAAAEPVNLDPVVEANRALLHQRSQVGIRKYGVTLGEANLPENDLVRHALEESLDLANYLQALLLRAAADRAPSKPQELSSVAPEVSNQAPEVGRAPSTEKPNFCDRCGKRLHAGSIHTCTPPGAPSTDSATERDAARYRWLREQMCFTTEPGQKPLMAWGGATAPGHDPHRDWMGDRFDASVDETVDAAIAAMKGERP